MGLYWHGAHHELPRGPTSECGICMWPSLQFPLWRGCWDSPLSCRANAWHCYSEISKSSDSGVMSIYCGTGKMEPGTVAVPWSHVCKASVLTTEQFPVCAVPPLHCAIPPQTPRSSELEIVVNFRLTTARSRSEGAFSVLTYVAYLMLSSCAWLMIVGVDE